MLEPSKVKTKVKVKVKIKIKDKGQGSIKTSNGVQNGCVSYAPGDTFRSEQGGPGGCL